jgi:hypothetical protein
VAKDIQGGDVRLLFEDVPYGVPEILNDAWPADLPRFSLGCVIEMLNGCFPRNALDGVVRDSRHTCDLDSLVASFQQGFDFVAF